MIPSSLRDSVKIHEVLMQLRVPIDLDLSPDGNKVAYSLADEDGSGAQVHILELDEGFPPRILHAPESTTTRHPRWSANMDVLVAAYSEAASAFDSLVAIDAQTGAHLWRQEIPGFIEDIVMSEDRIVVRFADPGSEQDGMHWGRRLKDSSEPWVSWPGKRWRRLAVTDISGSKFSVLDLAGWTVWDYDVSSDGTILAVASRDPLPSGYYLPTLIATSVDGETPRELWDGDQRQLSRPRLSKEGGRHAYVLRGLSIVSGRVYRVNLDGGEPKEIADLDDVTDMGSLPNGHFWFSGWTQSGVHLGLLNARGEVEIRIETPGLVTGRDSQPSLVVDSLGSRFIAVWEDGGHPPEISSIDQGDKSWRQLTRVNNVPSEIALMTNRRWVHWESTDGTQVLGLLLLPKYQDGPLPLVTILHGGPTWLVPDGFSPAESGGLALPLVHAGVAVLLPNPRGSSGRGQAYAEAVIGHMGQLDMIDVLTGIDRLVDQGVVNPAKLAVMGLSYGGFLSAWMLTQTSRFKTGIAMSSVADWLSFSQTSNIGGGFTGLYHYDAEPTSISGRSQLLDRSPAHLASQSTAPLLIIHGEQDRVTPVGQAEQLYGAWAAAGNQTEIVVYPREGHEMSEPEHLYDLRGRVFAWLEKHGILEQMGDE